MCVSWDRGPFRKNHCEYCVSLARNSSASILLRHDGSFARIDRPRSSCLLGSELSWAICPCPSTVSVRRARRARPARDSVSPSLVSCTAAAVSDSLWEPSLPALLAALLSLFGIQTRLVRPRCASVPLQGLAQLPLYKMFYFHFKSGSTRNCPM